MRGIAHRLLPHHATKMENPHAERQAVLLERILKNSVSHISHRTFYSGLIIRPVQGCVYRDDPRIEPLCRSTSFLRTRLCVMRSVVIRRYSERMHLSRLRLIWRPSTERTCSIIWRQPSRSSSRREGIGGTCVIGSGVAVTPSPGALSLPWR